MVKEIIKALFGSTFKSWIRNRALHTPDAKVGDAAKKVGISVDQWRLVEAFLADQASAAVDAL